MSRVNPLIHRFLEDPASLTEEDLDRLVAMLRDHPSKAVELREQLLIDDHLSQKLAIDRQNFFAQIEQRIADFERGEEEMYDHVAELRAIAEAQIDRPLRPSPRSVWLKYSLGAALSLLLLAGLVAWQFAAPPPRQVALVEELSGEVTLVRGNDHVQPQLRKPISTGDQVVSTAGSMIEWKYNDGTTVRIVGDAISQINADGRTGAKQVKLDRGELVAKVAIQQRGPMVFATPHAMATVRGTELRLVVDAGATQLDVTEGEVELTRHADGQTIQVAKNETGIASQERIALKLPEWPLDRSKAIYLFLGSPDSALCRNPQTGNFRQTELTSQAKANVTQRPTLVLEGNAFVSADDGADITNLLRKSAEFTIEIAFVPQATDHAAGGTLLSLGLPQSPSVELVQEGAWLLAQVAAVNGEPLELNLGELVAGKRSHVLVSGRGGNLVGYVAGSQTAETADIQLDPATWTDGPLSLGASFDGERPWRGEIVRLAIFGHFMNAQEARRERERFELVHP